MSNRNDTNAKQGCKKPDKGDESNLLVLRGVGSVERISTNVIIVKTTPDETITCVDEKGNKRQITLTREREVHLKKPLSSHTKGKYALQRDSKVQGSSRGASPIPETESDTDGSGSPTVSHPPEAETQGEEAIKDQGADIEIDKLTEALTGLAANQEDTSSLTTNLRDFLPKILKLDIENKRLKDHSKQLEEELAKTQAAFHRLEDAQKHVNGGSETSKKRGTPEKFDADAKRQNEEYSKMKRQLKKALEANQAWSNYSSGQLKVHLKQLHSKDEKIQQLEEKMKSVITEAATSENQLRTRLAETETQLKDKEEIIKELDIENKTLQEKNKQQDEEQKKVRKLARELVKTNEDFKTEIQSLKEELSRLTFVQSQEADNKTAQVKSNMSTSSSELRDSCSGLSNPLRNVESAMGNEKLTNIEAVNNNTENRFTKTEIVEMDGKQSSGDAASSVSSESNEVIYVLKEQVQQYRNDFIKERRDRERAVGELEKVKKDLENARLMLHQQGETKEKKKTKKVLPLFTSKPTQDLRKKSQRSSGAAFRYLGPEEVTELHERRPAGERQQNAYEDEGGERNHVYHEIDE